MTSLSSTTGAEPTAPRTETRTLIDRLVAALPLLSVYVWLSIVYLVEAWRRVTPWLFGDELELTQLSRAIADTGHAARRGEAHSFESLYTVVTAPLWLIHDVPTAYAGVKYVDVLLMTAVVFPTYFLARLVVGRRASLFAALGAGAIPALAYTGYVVEENLAYPYSTLCLYLIARAFVGRRRDRHPRRWVAAAVVACAIAPLVRGELVVIPAVGVLTVLFAIWSSDRMRARRRSWSIGDWIGAVLLLLGAVFAASGAASQRSLRWYAATTFYQDRLVNMSGWAAGALAVGIGVVPVVGGLAALVRLPGEQPSRELRAFRSLSLAALVCFGFYTAMKATLLSLDFATRVEERNLVYVTPLLFVGTALLLERRRVNLAALLGAGALALYLVCFAVYHPTQFPYEMNVQLYSDALGLAILQQANRFLSWTPQTARLVLLLLTVAGTVGLALLPQLRARTRLAGALAAGLAAVAIGWSLTGEIAAAAGSDSFGRDAAATLREPFSWVDEATNRAPTLYVGEGETDQNPENLLEFWNRSIVRVSSFDGTVGGPGPSGGPDLRADGRMLFDASPGNPDGTQYAYAVEDAPCVDLVGTTVATHLHRAGGFLKTWKLVRLARPNRVRSMCVGISPDGWTGPADSTYYRFPGSAGWLRVVVSRADWSGTTGPSPVHVLTGRLVINSNNQPALGRATPSHDLTVDSLQTKGVWVRVPATGIAVHVVVDRKFVPHAYDPHISDARILGAQVSYTFFAKLPKGAKP